jgi:DNA-binding transcriptional regulator YiaG
MDTHEPIIEYRPIPDFPGYRVGSDGSVWTCKDARHGLAASWRRRVTQINCNGYEAVGLHHQKTRRVFLVQALVLTCFVGPRPPGLWALHRNDNRLDNRLENLYWGTQTENVSDARNNGRFATGISHHQGKLTDLEVYSIRQQAAHGVTQRALAQQYHVAQATIWRIVRGYTHVTLASPSLQQARRLSARQVRDIRDLYASGMSCVALARRFHVGINTMRSIIKGRTRKYD